MRKTTTSVAVIATAIAMLAASPALAQKKYGPGASDTEIKLGNTVPYSGPASAYGILGKAYAAYFKMINEQGGINGRKINLISYDDAYSPPKTVEQTRKLVESDEVMAIVGNVGTASKCGDPEISQRQEDAAAVPRHRRLALERSEAVSVDDGLAAELPGRSHRPMRSIC